MPPKIWYPPIRIHGIITQNNTVSEFPGLECCRSANTLPYIYLLCRGTKRKTEPEFPTDLIQNDSTLSKPIVVLQDMTR